MVEAYQRLYGFELIVLRLANVYGVGHFAGGSGGGEMVQNMLQTGIKGASSRSRLPIEYSQGLLRECDEFTAPDVRQSLAREISFRRFDQMA